MAVSDHGLEVLKKAGEEVTPGDKSDYYHKVKLLASDNTELNLETNSLNQLKVVLDGRVDDENSSSTLLTADSIFTGTGVSTLDYSLIFVTVFSNVASATDGLCVQISSDDVTWRDGDCFTIPANTEKTFSFQTNKQYYRVRYTNGGTNQTTFDLQTILKKTNSKPSSHRIIDAISPQDDATLTKAVLTALNDLGVFANIGATKSNNLKVANVEDGLSIAKGDVVNTTFIHKFGDAPDFDIVDGFVTIWDGADDAHVGQMQYQYSSTDDIDSVSSGSGSDTFEIEIQGLDINYDLVVQTVTLTGQTRVALSTDLIRVFRMKNVNSTDNVGHVHCYVNTAINLGIPIDTTKNRAIIQPGNNQTLMAVYTIPAGKTGYMRDWYSSASGARKTSIHQVKLRARAFGKVFQVKHISSINLVGTSHVQHIYNEPEVFAEKTDLEMSANTDEDVAGISAGFDVVLIDN